MEKIINKKKAVIILILIILIQILFKIYIGYHKEGFHIDELYSYGLMNHKTAYIFDNENFENNWHTKEYLNEYITISEEEKENWAPIYSNQIEDYHPPLYYVLLRIAASFTIDNFTKWTGLILNIIIFICCSIVLYNIGKVLFGEKNIYVFILVILYGFSKFSTENTLFIRMYQLLELQVLLLTFWSIKNYNKDKLKFKDILEFVIIVTLGTLTHYYFIIFLLGIFIVNLIKRIKTKNLKDIIKFILSIIVSQILIYLIFPGYFTQLSKNFTRCSDEKIKVQFIEKLLKFLSRQNDYFKLICNHMFYLNFGYILLLLSVIGLVLIIIKIVKDRKNLKIIYDSKINVLLIPTLIYWFLIVKTSPYTDIRYILPIFVFVLILIVYVLKSELENILKNKKMECIILCIVCLCCVFPLGKNNELEYQYFSNKETIEKIKQYADIPCIYMYSGGGVLENGFLNDFDYLRNFNNIYIMNRDDYSISNLKKALKEIDATRGFIIFDIGENLEVRIPRIIKKMDEFNNYEVILEITQDRILENNLCLINNK